MAALQEAFLLASCSCPEIRAKEEPMDSDNTSWWDGMRIEDAPPSAGFPGGDDDSREQLWPGEASEGEVWWFRLNADWPGEDELVLGSGTRDEEQFATSSAVEWADDLKDRSTAQHLRMMMDLVAAAMDPRSPGVLN
jgi:hypothetical protein